MRGQRAIGHGADTLQRIKHRHGTDATVTADHINSPARQLGGECFWSGTVEAVTVFVDGDLRDHGNVRRYCARGANSLMQFLQRAESLQDEEVGTGFHLRRDLFEERLVGFIQCNFAQGLNPNAEWPHGCGDIGVETLGSLAGEANARCIDLANLVSKTET